MLIFKASANIFYVCCSQLSQVKSFSKGQVYASATDCLTGQVSLEEFSRLMKQQEKMDELRQFGLTEEEISIKLRHDTMLHEKVCKNQSSLKYLLCFSIQLSVYHGQNSMDTICMMIYGQ